MKFNKGDRVKHPKMNEWGLGEVLEDSKDNKVRIFFVGDGEKTLSLQHVQLEMVLPEEAHHPVLDNLKVSKASSKVRYQSFSKSKNDFLEQYPEGFYGKRFNEEERDYKVQANNLALELLNRETFQSLLENADYPDICKRALKIVNATNLIFPNEKMALKDGLSQKEDECLFAESLFRLLYGEGELKERFISFSKLLEDIHADKWTTASYFLFIVHPDKFMFVKPTITQHSSELCGYEINYKPQLNWLTYKSVLDFSEYLKSELVELKPRDMIDVQSFMWCIAPR